MKTNQYGKDQYGNKNYQGKEKYQAGSNPKTGTDTTKKAPTQGGYSTPGGGGFNKDNLDKSKTNQPGQNQWGTGSISDKNKGGTDTNRR